MKKNKQNIILLLTGLIISGIFVALHLYLPWLYFTNDEMLMRGINRGEIATVKKALERGANPNCINDVGFFPLGSVCSDHQEESFAVEAVKLLLAHGADPNGSIANKSPLNNLVFSSSPNSTKNRKLCELLLQNGANPHKTSAYGYRSLYECVVENNRPLKDLFVKYAKKH